MGAPEIAGKKMDGKWMQKGWLVFTLAAVVWIMPFGVVWITQGNIIAGSAAVVLCLVATAVDMAFVPWKYPDTRLWKLLIPPYAAFIASVLLLVYVLTRFESLSEIQYGLWLIPCFVPFFTFGHKTWNSFFDTPSQN